MALDMTPEQKEIGKGNFYRTVGKLAEADADAAAQAAAQVVAQAPTPAAAQATAQAIAEAAAQAAEAHGGRGITRRRFMRGMLAAGATTPIAAAAYFGYTRERDGGGGFRPVRAGLIGSGDEGGVLVGEHNPRYLEFIAYSDIRPSNQKRIFEDERRTNPNSPRKGFKYHYGSEAPRRIRLYEDYHELLRNPEIEAVVIALPLNLHAQVAIDAMRAGKHVLCEKLMAWNIRQCKDMIRVANETDRVLSIGHQRHYSMLYAHAVEVINSGVLGEIRHIRALWHRNNSLPRIENGREVRPEEVVVDGVRRRVPVYRDSWRPAIKADDRRHLDQAALRRHGFKNIEELVRWRLYTRTGGGLMAELGSHQLDACSIFLGKVHALAVTGVGGKYFYRDDRETEDHVFCTFEFPGKNYFGEGQEAQGQRRVNDPNDKVIVTYSSINTNSFEPYGECVMGNRGTLVVEMEQNAMLWGGAGRSTSVSVSTAGGGAPALTSGASDSPGDRRAASRGEASLGHEPVSRGYREEMEHFAYVIRTRDQASGQDRANLQVRCPGPAAMADAIIALTANQAMRHQRRIEFDPRWFDPASTEVPDADMRAVDADGNPVQL
jgi:predicted dehydrogenase